MKTHEFALILAGVSGITPEQANDLFEATGGDIEFSMRDGVAYLEFEQEADTLQDAVVSAMHDVKRADVGVRVVRVESDAANTIAKINAELLGATSL